MLPQKVSIGRTDNPVRLIGVCSPDPEGSAFLIGVSFRADNTPVLSDRRKLGLLLRSQATPSWAGCTPGASSTCSVDSCRETNEFRKGRVGPGVTSFARFLHGSRLPLHNSRIRL